ncbi:hypothetical protein BXQ17_03730 [Polaribacter sp. BM10]|uniref:hypothetical protein n=1 Tax=Polaribacter sp. BM10 TaxID=1529069 RepID=UPI00098AA29F|nr:hypothetical protein [Polaribacter sp. BM10]AQS93240.1 hypothetical protein BXQ17_03730 [Polaribacter sp. BM10]
MKTNKLDNSVKEKFANRTLEPSVSAWERLSTKLDEEPKQKKKGWFFYIGYAASVIVIISIGFFIFSDEDIIIKNDTIIVEEVIDTVNIIKNIEEHFNEIPVEKAIVENEKSIPEKTKKIDNNKRVISSKSTKVAQSNNKNKKLEKSIVDKTTRTTTVVFAKNEVNPSSDLNKEKFSITVNADDLLKSVSTKSKKVEAYYANNNISEEELLKAIKSELIKSDLKVNPETILAEVERSINDDVFENNFLKSLKKKISNIATAIASRNN